MSVKLLLHVAWRHNRRNQRVIHLHLNQEPSWNFHDYELSGKSTLQVHTLDVQMHPVNTEPESTGSLIGVGNKEIVLNVLNGPNSKLDFKSQIFNVLQTFWTPLYVIKCSGVKSEVMSGVLGIWECTVPDTVTLFLVKQNSPRFSLWYQSFNYCLTKWETLRDRERERHSTHKPVSTSVSNNWKSVNGLGLKGPTKCILLWPH